MMLPIIQDTSKTIIYAADLIPMADSEISRLRDVDDLYEVLDLERTATTAQLKKAYRKLARQYHPDKHPPSEKEAMEAKPVPDD